MFSGSSKDASLSVLQPSNDIRVHKEAQQKSLLGKRKMQEEEDSSSVSDIEIKNKSV